MPKGHGIAFIECLYLHFLCFYFLFASDPNKYKKIFLYRSISPIEETRIGTIVSVQSGPGSNDNEENSIFPRSPDLEPYYQM